MAHGISKTIKIQGKLVAKMLKDGKPTQPKQTLAESVKHHAAKNAGYVRFIKTRWGGYFVRDE